LPSVTRQITKSTYGVAGYQNPYQMRFYPIHRLHSWLQTPRGLRVRNGEQRYDIER